MIVGEGVEKKLAWFGLHGVGLEVANKLGLTAGEYCIGACTGDFDLYGLFFNGGGLSGGLSKVSEWPLAMILGGLLGLCGGCPRRPFCFTNCWSCEILRSPENRKNQYQS